MNRDTPRGPIEDGTWPTTLEAHVVEPGPVRRIHGYAAVADLARHYGSTEISWLTYTGELPNAVQHQLYDLALSLLAPAAITCAASHAAVLTRLLAAPNANVVAVAAMVCAEHANAEIVIHAPWLAWCAAPTGEAPSEFLAGGDDDTASVVRERLVALGVELPAVTRHTPTTTATALALLHACGLHDPLRLTAVVVQAQLPCLIAEAERHTPRRLQHYPIELPVFAYQEGEDD